MSHNKGRNTHRLGTAISIMPLPIFAILAITLHLLEAGNSPVFDPPGLLPILNLLFLCMCPMVAGYAAAGGYLKKGSTGLISMSSGVFVLAIGSLIAGFFFQTRGPNANITIYNVSAFLAGVLHLAGAVLVLVGFPPEQDARKRRHNFIILFSGIFAVLMILTYGVYADLWPTFFIQGQGPTLLRQVVLLVAVFSFSISGLLFALFYRSSRNEYLYWYGLGILLIATGLACIFTQKSFGGPIGWLGRISQYLGGLYLVIAVFKGAKGAGVKPTQLSSILDTFFRNRFESLLVERTTELAQANEKLGREIIIREQGEKELQESKTKLTKAEARYRTVANFTYDWETWHSPEQELLFVSPSCERITGYSPDDFIANNNLFVEILLPADRRAWRKHVLERARKGFTDLPALEFRLRHKNGGVRWIEHTCMAVNDDGRHHLGVRGSNREITQRKVMAEESRHAREELAHVSRVATVVELSASLSHEISQPLTAVRTNARAARNFLGKEPPDLGEVDDALSGISEAAERAGTIIHQLRSLLKREEIKKKPLDLNAVVSSTVEILKSEAVKNRVEVSVDLAGELPPVAGDRTQIQQVLLNLMLNAFEAMQATPENERVLQISSTLVEGVAEIVFRDSGPGIAPAILEKVLEPFVSTKEQGLGMGLAISRSIIEAHGGRIHAKNSPNSGASFVVSIPATDGRRS
jgi:PAS domain S-box-containing protein